MKLKIDRLSKSFTRDGGAGILAIDALTIDVAELEFLAIVGPSGCGKSTLLRIIDGLEASDSGEVLIDGRPAHGPGGTRAMVFQSFNLLPWRTTIDNVAFGLELRGVARAERYRISQRFIDIVGLKGFERAYPHELSGGMQQRVGIARALAIRPEILLMDEPFGSLDVQTRDLLQDELMHILDAEPRTAILVTHSIEEAIYLADRIVVLTPRPARICMELPVRFPRPRREEIKDDAEFVRIRREIWKVLKSGAQAAL